MDTDNFASPIIDADKIDEEDLEKLKVRMYNRL
jgi:hypothetical protein